MIIQKRAKIFMIIQDNNTSELSHDYLRMR